MSRIDELIAEHCPDGVEFKELQELFVTKNGYTPSTTNKAYWTDGTVPWFRMEDIRENGRILNKSLQQITEEAVKGGRLFPANSIIIATSATIGEHALITVPHLSNQRFTSLALKPEFIERLDMKFVFYYCFVLDDWCRKNITTSSFASVDMNGFKKFCFPLPHIEVQREIVKVLDTFTKLEAELEAELEARRRQYQYYRDALLTFGERTDADAASKQASKQARITTLSEITTSIASGRNKQRMSEGAYPVYGSTGLLGYSDEPAYSGDALLVARVGANAGLVNAVSGDFDVSDNTLVVRPSSDWDVRFAFHQMTHMNLNQYAVGGGQPLVTGGLLKNLKVLLPPLEEQERIASILDKFDVLVNDLSSGLPAEIKARRQQYEHYRDKLLSFAELEATA